MLLNLCSREKLFSLRSFVFFPFLVLETLEIKKMAKRELSTTLRNLKFMQRAAPKEEPKPAKEEEEKEPDQSSFGASNPAPKKRCVVIMEGNPRPGAIKGRMSFQSFNPSIDKLHEEASNVHQTQAANTSYQNGGSDRGGSGESKMRSEDSNVADSSSDPDIDLKRKQPEMEMKKPSPNKLQKVESEESNGQSSSHDSSKGPNKQKKRDKLDWNVLRPPRPQI